MSKWKSKCGVENDSDVCTNCKTPKDKAKVLLDSSRELDKLFTGLGMDPNKTFIHQIVRDPKLEEKEK